MNIIVTLDKAGRVVIPKTLRDELHLEPGDSLSLHAEGDKLVLRPLRTQTLLRKERGVWMYRTGKLMSAGLSGRTLRELREEQAMRSSEGGE